MLVTPLGRYTAVSSLHSLNVSAGITSMSPVDANVTVVRLSHASKTLFPILATVEEISTDVRESQL